MAKIFTFNFRNIWTV